MTTNPYAEAIEAARLALQDRTGRTRQSTQRDAETAVDAATPRLLAPIRALADDFRDNVDWSDGRNGYGDNEAYEKCARDLANLCNQIEGARDE